MSTTTNRHAELAASVNGGIDTKLHRQGTLGTRALVTLWPDATRGDAGANARHPSHISLDEVALTTAGAPQPQVPVNGRQWSISSAVHRVVRPLAAAIGGRQVVAGATLRFPTADGASDAELARLNQERMRSSVAATMRDEALAITTGIALYR